MSLLLTEGFVFQMYAENSRKHYLIWTEAKGISTTLHCERIQHYMQSGQRNGRFRLMDNAVTWTF